MPEVMSNNQDGAETFSIPITVIKTAADDHGEASSRPKSSEARRERGYIIQSIDDAERLLRYAAETGITVD